MPKGRKRTQAEYEKEIEEAAERMKKKPEHLKSAKDNATWLEHLENIGVTTTGTKQGQSFWEKVRNKIVPTRPRYTEPYVNPKTKQVSYRDSKGRFASYKSLGIPKRAKPVRQEPTLRQLAEERVYIYKNPKTMQVSYRDSETGRFKKIEV